jgi:hypothetical protein
MNGRKSKNKKNGIRLASEVVTDKKRLTVTTKELQMDSVRCGIEIEAKRKEKAAAKKKPSGRR